MKVEAIVAAEEQAKVFLERVKELKLVLMEEGKSVLFHGCRESAALKRASMELSNKLIELRKP